LNRYLGLADYFWLAELVTGVDTTTLLEASRVELADSALHAPAAGFGDDDARRVGVAADVRGVRRRTLGIGSARR
jgi:hypothetical protein